MSVRNLFAATIVIVGAAATFYLLLVPARNVVDIEVTPGQVFPHDIIAPVDFDLPYSHEEFQRIREDYFSSIPIHLRFDPAIWPELSGRIHSGLLALTGDSSFTAGMVRELEEIYNEGVFDLKNVREYYAGDRAVVLRDGTSEDRNLFDLNEVSDVRETLIMRAGNLEIPRRNLDTLAAILEPNLMVDASARQVEAETAVSRLSNIDTTITAGSILLPAGQPVTARTVQYIEQLKRVELENRELKTELGLVLLALILVGIALYYVHDMMPKTWGTPNRFMLLGTIWILALAATGAGWLALGSNTVYPYATMVTFGATLTSIFFHRRHAVFMTVIFSLITAMVHPHPYTVVLTGTVSGILAAMAAWDVRQRRSIPLATGLSAAGGTGVFLVLKLMDTSLYSQDTTWGALGLLLAPVVGIGSASALLLIFERIFGVYTVLSIEEVNKTDHPLLKKMREVAPGTWNHSQLVAELAGRAAGAIGAWEALASAGGYFHDIGKMKNPELFIENQRTDENPHDSMDPKLSARRIIAHVKDGVKMAKKAKLPRAVIDIIAQHHGTSLVRYFYNKAVREAGDPSLVDKKDFTYPGPKPTSNEAVLVMLADQVASATRNLATPEEVAAIVSKVVDEKDLEGELDECHITRRNLKTIVEVFTTTLESKFYKRVRDYPMGDDSSG